MVDRVVLHHHVVIVSLKLLLRNDRQEQLVAHHVFFMGLGGRNPLLSILRRGLQVIFIL